MRHIFTIIDHLSPSTYSESPNQFSEHTYFIYLDRLIYYYNLYELLSKNELNGFENTAVLVITSHGQYKTLEDVIDLSPTPTPTPTPTPPNLQNFFICTKASPGTVSVECAFGMKDKKYASDGNMFDQIYESITQFKAFSFDGISTNIHKMKSGITAADCWVVNKQFGKSMQHYISPSTNKFINKHYTGSFIDYTDSMIDIQRFNNFKTEEDLKTRLRNSNILFDPNILEGTPTKTNPSFVLIDETTQNILEFSIMLEDIIKYYNKLGVKNLFIYDLSCGVLENDENYDSIIEMASRHGSLQTFRPEYFTRKKDEIGSVIKKNTNIGLGVSKKINKKIRKTRKAKTMKPRVRVTISHKKIKTRRH
jgi:hypothetical protein